MASILLQQSHWWSVWKCLWQKRSRHALDKIRWRSMRLERLRMLWKGLLQVVRYNLWGGLGITKGMKVLDLGCGDGTTALPAARLGAEVVGVDIARNLVEAGNRRAQELGLVNCRFQEGDATNLTG